MCLHVVVARLDSRPLLLLFGVGLTGSHPQPMLPRVGGADAYQLIPHFERIVKYARTYLLQMWRKVNSWLCNVVADI